MMLTGRSPGDGLGLVAVGESDPGRLGLGRVGSFVADTGGPLARRVSLRVGRTTVRGSLSPEVVKRIIRQNLPALRTCYAHDDPSVTGRVAVTFAIRRRRDAWSVENAWSVEDDGSDLPEADATACVRRELGEISFPEPGDDEVAVSTEILGAAHRRNAR